jgi:hypothetical protein
VPILIQIRQRADFSSQIKRLTGLRHFEQSFDGIIELLFRAICNKVVVCSAARPSKLRCGFLLDPAMNLSDATLVLLLAARIHGTDDAVRASARRCMEQLPNDLRDVMRQVIASPQPLQSARDLARTLEG